MRIFVFHFWILILFLFPTVASASLSVGWVADYFKIKSTENVGGNETNALSNFTPGLNLVWDFRIKPSFHFFVDAGFEKYSLQALTTGQAFSPSSGLLKHYGLGFRQMLSHRFRVEFSFHANEALFVHVVSPTAVEMDSQMISSPQAALHFQAFDLIHIGFGFFAEYGMLLASATALSGNHLAGGLSLRNAANGGFAQGPELQWVYQLNHQNTSSTIQSDQRVGLQFVYHWRTGT